MSELMGRGRMLVAMDTGYRNAEIVHCMERGIQMRFKYEYKYVHDRFQ